MKLGFGLFLLFTLMINSCGKEKSEAEFYEFNQDKLIEVTNNYSSDLAGTSELEKTIFNEEKGIYFKLFKDNILTYKLIGLGEGEGFWNIKEKALVMNADTGLFDMYIEIKQHNENDLYFHYRDRFGRQVVKVQTNNE